mmetsp:Transcript_63155/g.72422  ORF Transcript_63155/g.72422 Transcript_63155/m.72422 type:complete len:306 (-) Transcript_63155:45-962(-)
MKSSTIYSLILIKILWIFLFTHFPVLVIAQEWINDTQRTPNPDDEDGKSCANCPDNINSFWNYLTTMDVTNCSRTQIEECYITKASPTAARDPTTHQEHTCKDGETFLTMDDYFTMSRKFEDKRAEVYYLANPLEDYRVDFPKDLYYLFMIKINPCVGRDTEMCCQDSGEGGCADEPSIVAGPDMNIAFTTNTYIFHCSDQYTVDFEGGCGTYIEIHRPGNTCALYAKKIQETLCTGFVHTLLTTKTLCAGRYELWWVIRSRSGRTLQYVKPFFVRHPSCTPEQVIEARRRKINCEMGPAYEIPA